MLIVAAARTGTNLLRSCLRADPRLYHIGEFLNPRVKDGREANFWARPELYANKQFADSSTRSSRGKVLQRYVRELVAQHEDRIVLADFKYSNAAAVDSNWRTADKTPDILGYFLDEGARVIHLTRRNLLEQFCSHQLALETDTWVALGEPSATPPLLDDKLVIDIDTLVGELRRLELRIELAEAWLETYSPVLRLQYEGLLVDGLLAPDVRSAINKMLGFDLEISGLPQTQKITPPLNQTIENFDAVKECLKGTRYESFAEPAASSYPGVIDDQTGWAKPIARPRPLPQGGPGLRRAVAARLASAVAPPRAPGRLEKPRTVLFAWELGAGLGHLRPMAEIGAELGQSDVRPVYAVRDLSLARQILAESATILQAPVWPSHRHFGSVSSLASYADVLAAVGFSDARKLDGVVRGWEDLIALVRPDAIVLDHSPGLLIALSGQGIPVVHIGSAFTMPPVGYERLPLLRGDQAPTIPEARLLEIVRGVQRKRGRPEAPSLSAALLTDKRIVFGMPELDPYASFRRESIVAPPGGLPAAQERLAGSRLFVYLGSEGASFEILAQALTDLDLPLEIYLRGESGPIPTFLRSRGATVHDTPPPLDEVLARCSHVLTEGGALTSAAALAAGRPQLVAPLHAEAEINLRLLQERRVAWRLDKAKSDQVGRALRQFVSDRPLAEQAAAEARRLSARPLPDGKAVVARAVAEVLS